MSNDTLYSDLLDAQTETKPDYDSARVTRWKLGHHSMRPETDTDDLYTDAAKNRGIDDDLSQVLQSAASMLEDAKLVDFECPVCGLGHGHDDRKHDIRRDTEAPNAFSPGFRVTEEFAEGMEFNPHCHCGVNELAMLVDFHDLFAVPMFWDEDDRSEEELEARFDEIRRAASNARVSDAVDKRIESIRAELEDLRDEQDDGVPSPVDDEDDDGFRF